MKFRTIPPELGAGSGIVVTMVKAGDDENNEKNHKYGLIYEADPNYQDYISKIIEGGRVEIKDPESKGSLVFEEI